MTQQEIIDMARQAGMSGLVKGKLIDEFKEFAELVAQKKRKNPCSLAAQTRSADI